MSTALTDYPIRLFCDLATPNILQDLNRGGATPFFYRGDDIEIDIGIGILGALLPPAVTGVASVTAQIFAAENDTNSPMMSCTVLAAAMNLALTAVNWNATPYTSANSHAQFLFPNSQTAISLGGAASVNYWLRITAQTTDATAKTITLLDGPITVKDGPITNVSAPPLQGFKIVTIGGQQFVAILDGTTGLYHALFAENDAGMITLGISDTGY